MPAVIGWFFLTGTQSYRATMKTSSVGKRVSIRISQYEDQIRAKDRTRAQTELLLFKG